MELLKLTYAVGKLQSLVDERHRLVTILHMKASVNDTVNLKKQLNATLELLNDTETELAQSEEPQFEEMATLYNALVAKIPDDAVDKGLYKFTPVGRARPGTETKKVRFKDDLLEFQEHPQDQQPEFEPYTDDVPQQEQERTRLFASNGVHSQGGLSVVPQLSNQDLFIQQQQQLLEQDSHLQDLSHSVHRGHTLSLDINHEMTDQNESVLRDLESLVDNSGRNLDRAKKRLQIYEKTARENGPCLIIVILSLILIVLLIAL
ncbi:LADA_0F06964g1_1 [Lachancea dasiensis]|uniref:LADA_0F06964g1_1 n=1 Tax=Lachancea dasiensis TaxID=1072105 RepID=A0A1G4JK30_9SACH|nr:LADA_0F06964g1_1 [Lachancea dasiensis]